MEKFISSEKWLKVEGTLQENEGDRARTGINEERH